MSESLDLIVARDGARVRLLAPSVGWFTRSRPTGEVLSPGQDAGSLVTLGRSATLRVPNGVTGRIVSPGPELVRAPVDRVSVLYELEAVSAGDGDEAQLEDAASDAATGLVVTAPQSGRLYRSRAPGEPPLVSVGDEVSEGSAVGLIEIMKTFNHIHYHATGSLPERGRVVEWLVDDGADVRRGDPLLRVEAL